MKISVSALFVLAGLICATAPALADAVGKPVAPVAVTKAALPDRYLAQAGDVLSISVWKEDDLKVDVLVRPDGGFSFPLAGDVQASGKSIDQLRLELVERLKVYIPDPVVTVAVKEIGGNHIYVLGKVNRPGEFPFSRPVDVMQALSLAGGTTAYAAINDIVILRRDNERIQALRFHYSEVEHGKELAQNVLLHSGDTVVVP